MAMAIFKRIKVPLLDEEFEALERLAVLKRRNTEAQASILIRIELQRIGFLPETDDESPVLSRLLTLREVADVLQVSRTHAYRLAQSGELRSVRFGSCVRVRKVDLETFVLQKLSSDRSEDLR
jgi:excisionase family DNA binding protein